MDYGHYNPTISDWPPSAANPNNIGLSYRPASNEGEVDDLHKYDGPGPGGLSEGVVPPGLVWPDVISPSSLTATGDVYHDSPHTGNGKQPILSRPGLLTHADSSAGKSVKRRVKSGCLTCRKRRIKCGEEKPICHNCVKTRRHCEPAAVPKLTPRQQKAAAARERSRVRRRQSTGEMGIGGFDDTGDLLSSSLGQPSHLFPHSMVGGVLGDAPPTPLDSLISPGVELQPSVSDSPNSALDFFGFDVAEPSFQTGTVAMNKTATDPYWATPASETTVGPSTWAQRPGGMAARSQSSLAYSDLAAEPASAGLPLLSPGLAPPGSMPGRQPSGDYFAMPVRKATAPSAATPPRDELLDYFRKHVNFIFVDVDEVRPAGGVPYDRSSSVRQGTLFNTIIPRMAMTCPALLHACHAMAKLHQSNAGLTQGPYDTSHYDAAVKALAASFQDADAADRNDLLAATLLLAYHDTATGEHHRWGKHLQGARNLVERRLRGQFANTEAGFVPRPSTLVQLIWCYISQDASQSFISGQPIIDKSLVVNMPLRGEPGSITYASDALRVAVIRLNDFVGRDRKRKEQLASNEDARPNANSTMARDFASTEWRMLFGDFTNMQTKLAQQFEVEDVVGSQTPFGKILVYKHPSIAALAMMCLTSIIILHRARPDLSPAPAEAVKATARQTFGLSMTVLRMFSGVMTLAVNASSNADRGSHVSAMMNCVLPGFIAGVVFQEDGQRDYLVRMLEDCYTLTGWKTALRVVQGLTVAWGREKVPEYVNLPLSVSHHPAVQRETQYTPSRTPSLAAPGSAQGGLHSAAETSGSSSAHSSPNEARAGLPRPYTAGGPTLSAGGDSTAAQRVSPMPPSGSAGGPIGQAPEAIPMRPKYLTMDSSQRLNEAVGVLGRLKLTPAAAQSVGDRPIGLTDDCENLAIGS